MQAARQSCQRALCRIFGEEVSDDLQGWWRHRFFTQPPPLLDALESNNALAQVLSQTLKEDDDDDYWRQLLNRSEQELAHIAALLPLLERTRTVQQERQLRRAVSLRWQGNRVLLLNSTDPEVAALLAQRCEVAIVWRWEYTYHLCIASNQRNSLLLAAQFGAATGTVRCAHVSCDHFLPPQRWTSALWFVAGALSAVLVLKAWSKA